LTTLRDQMCAVPGFLLMVGPAGLEPTTAAV
jgi:hypothetical protein